MLVVDSVSKSYGSVRAVSDLSLKIDRGEIFGLLGPNGAGKTTLIKMLAGFHYPDAGQILIDESDIVEDSPGVLSRLGYLPENAPLYKSLTIGEYLDFHIASRISERQKRRILKTRAMERCGLDGMERRIISHLSKGYRQRVGIAQAIIHEPDIVILDEPTAGLDPNQLVGIRNLIRELGREKTVILSTHILQEVEAVCDRIAIISNGSLAAERGSRDISGGTSAEQYFYVEAPGSSEDALRAAFSLETGFTSLKVHNRGFIIGVSQSLDTDAGSMVFKTAVSSGITLSILTPQKQSVEDVFHQVTRGRT